MKRSRCQWRSGSRSAAGQSPVLHRIKSSFFAHADGFIGFPQSKSTVTDAAWAHLPATDIFTVGRISRRCGDSIVINSVHRQRRRMSQLPSYDPATGNVTLSFDGSSLWACSRWGAQSLWGGAQSLWGRTIALGCTIALGRFQILNGSNCLWEHSPSGGGASSASRFTVHFGGHSRSRVRNRFGARSHFGALTRAR